MSIPRKESWLSNLVSMVNWMLRRVLLTWVGKSSRFSGLWVKITYVPSMYRKEHTDLYRSRWMLLSQSRPWRNWEWQATEVSPWQPSLFARRTERCNSKTMELGRGRMSDVVSIKLTFSEGSELPVPPAGARCGFEYNRSVVLSAGMILKQTTKPWVLCSLLPPHVLNQWFWNFSN